MKTTAILTAVALMIMLCASIALSQQSAPAGQGQAVENPNAGRPMVATRPPQASNIDRVGNNIGLTESQKNALKPILTKYEEDVDPLLKKLTESSNALQNAIFASKYDEKKVKELAVNAAKAESAVVNANVEAWTKIRTVLSAEQMVKLGENRQSQAGVGACFEQGPTGRGPGAATGGGMGPAGGGQGTGRGPVGGGPGDGRGRQQTPTQ